MCVDDSSEVGFGFTAPVVVSGIWSDDCQEGTSRDYS